MAYFDNRARARKQAYLHRCFRRYTPLLSNMEVTFDPTNIIGSHDSETMKRKFNATLAAQLPAELSPCFLGNTLQDRPRMSSNCPLWIIPLVCYPRQSTPEHTPEKTQRRVHRTFCAPPNHGHGHAFTIAWKGPSCVPCLWR
jgi:hypothetical protein